MTETVIRTICKHCKRVIDPYNPHTAMIVHWECWLETEEVKVT
jgi:hypothetical protein